MAWNKETTMLCAHTISQQEEARGGGGGRREAEVAHSGIEDTVSVQTTRGTKMTVCRSSSFVFLKSQPHLSDGNWHFQPPKENRGEPGKFPEVRRYTEIPRQLITKSAAIGSVWGDSTSHRCPSPSRPRTPQHPPGASRTPPTQRLCVTSGGAESCAALIWSMSLSFPV